MKTFYYKYFLFFVCSGLWSQNKVEWIPPLDIPFALSGTFGEPRSTHFHLGLDIKTQGKEGWEVKSIAQGQISRIRVSLGGYGKVVYVDHPDQTTSVYAHLKKFAPKIEAYVKSIQYQKESYILQEFPKANELTLEAGELIGYSGNTGGSSGPHLHFEIRDTKSQKPFNPLLFDLPIKDSQRPQLQKLYLFYPRENHPLSYSEAVELQKINDSTYTTPMVLTSGKIGLGLQMFDRQDLSYNKNGIYKAQLQINGKTIAHYEFDQLDYSDSKKLFHIIDYPSFQENRIKIQKLFFQDQPLLTFIKSVKQGGLFHIELGKSYQLMISVQDFFGNTSYIEMYIEGTEKSITHQPLEGKDITPEKDHLLLMEKAEIYFPKKTFFKKVKLQIEENEKSLSIGPNLFPFQMPYEIRFKAHTDDSLKLKQSFIVKKTDEKLSYLPTTLKEGYWITQLKDMGEYTLARDTIAPQVVAVNFKPEQWLSKFKFLNLKISDDFSGVKSYKGSINGQWVLFEYEPKKDLLTYDFSDKTFDQAKHQLRLEVEDNAGNTTIYETVFFKKYTLD